MKRLRDFSRKRLMRLTLAAVGLFTAVAIVLKLAWRLGEAAAADDELEPEVAE